VSLAFRVALGARRRDVLRLVALSGRNQRGLGNSRRSCTQPWSEIVSLPAEIGEWHAGDPIMVLARVAGCSFWWLPLACMVPARRALGIDPMAALRLRVTPSLARAYLYDLMIENVHGSLGRT